MPAETHIKPKLVVKLEKAEWWQQPPVILRERLLVVERVVLRLRDKHDKMD